MNTLPTIAAALSRAQKSAAENQANILRSRQILRADRELLLKTGWLQEIIKGWYLLAKPDVLSGDSAAWYANFWDFLRVYLDHHFKTAYCLSAESSLDLHTACSTIPKQVIVIVAKGGGTPQQLPYGTSVLIYADPNNLPEERAIVRGLQVMTLPLALCKVTPTYFQKNAQEAEIALRLLRDPSELTEILIKHNFKNAANRLIAALEFTGLTQASEQLKQNLSIVGWNVREENPFSSETSLLSTQKIASPYAARILALWKEYRQKIIPYFPASLTENKSFETYLHNVEELYEQDAYNSLSIEGYQVNEELIARIRQNEWNPEMHPEDRTERNALAARGYYETFLQVKQSMQKIFQGENVGKVVEDDLSKWFQSLFAPMMRAGILRPEELFGYRKNQVYIRGSRHVPLPKEALIDAMQTLFQCLKEEEDAAVRAVLGHYIFVYIHPYMDGNGRIGRFLMNLQFASGRYPWTIIRVKHRTQYLNALEAAGPGQDIEPLAKFIAQEMQASL